LAGDIAERTNLPEAQFQQEQAVGRFNKNAGADRASSGTFQKSGASGFHSSKIV
jgi:hypothetical protein